jgi:hypothetical protein
VHDRVQATEAVHRLSYRGGHGIRVADIGDQDERRRRSARPALAGRLVERATGSGQERDPVAAPGAGQSRRAADAAGRSGDEDDARHRSSIEAASGARISSPFTGFPYGEQRRCRPADALTSPDGA